MAEYATKDDLKSFREELSAKIDSTVSKAVKNISEIISSFAQQVDERFNTLEKHLVEQNIKFDLLLNKIDGFLS